MDVKVFQARGFPSYYYFVKTPAEWYTLCMWMNENKVWYLQEISSPQGIGFSILDNREWFLLKWG